MNDKTTLLEQVKAALRNGIISEADLRGLLDPDLGAVTVVSPPIPAVEPTAAVTESRRLAVMEVLFYLAGLIFYIGVMVAIFQLGSDQQAAGALVCMAIGFGIWTGVYYLGKRAKMTDVHRGLTNALLLAGSLCVASGGYLYASRLSGESSGGLAYAAAVASLLLGCLFLAFDRLYRHTMLITFAILLLTAAGPAFVVGLLANQTVPADVWAVVGIATGALLAFGGTVAARSAPGREDVKRSFESFAAFIILGSIYGAGVVSNAAVVWEVMLAFAIYGAFYLSINRRSRQFLVAGSFFLVVFLITVAFKYFSGLGASFCLFLSAASLLGTAFMASSINKRYIKAP